ncbi:MAG: hypothetical protein IT368_15305, partial [Candidatus Hydrogenedentes bacterium]|nr:hypothetical protein [Candidatus Hydrogenedentota bacterium]
MLFRVISLALIACTGLAAGQSFQWQETRAQIRDAHIDAAAGRIYAAAYDRDEIWVYDLATLERIQRIEAGEGPVALAAAGNVLACANRNSGTVTLIQLPQLSVVGSVATGAGAIDIAALPDGRFAVANSFEDSVSLVSPATQTAVSLSAAPLVPIGVAADGEYLAILGRVEPVVSIYTAPGYALAGTVKLAGTPLQAAPLGNGLFAVRTADKIYVIDAARRTVDQERPLATTAMETADGRVYAVDASAVQVLDTNLAPLDTLALSQPASGFAAAGNVQIALAPKLQGWQVRTIGGAPVIAAAPAPTPEPEAAPVVAEAETIAEEMTPAPAAEPRIAEAEPIEAEETAVPATQMEEPVEAEPVVVAYAPEESPAPEVSATPVEPPAAPPAPVAPEVAAQEPAPAPVAEAATPATAAPEGRKQTIYTEGSLPRPEIRAPSAASRRPSPLPVAGPPEKSVSDMLRGNVGFDALENALQAPDWTQPLRDIEADTARGTLDTDVTVWEGNVHLRLENTFFQADRFQHTRSTGEMVATGNVRITQGETIVTADQITYKVPVTQAGQAPPVLEPTEDTQLRAKASLGRGSLEAYNIRVVEPFREFQAEYVNLDLASSVGEMRGAEGTAGVYYVYAEHVNILGPESFDAANAWITTCASPSPPYRINVKNLEVRDGDLVSGQQARLQLGKFKTPIFVPFLKGKGEKGWSFDFDSGREAELGFFLNAGAQYSVTPDVSIGPRIFATEDEGVGLGGDLEYDFMENPASRLYRTKGDAHGIYTTEERG